MFTPNPYGLFSMPTLETPRLILRRIAVSDAKDIFAYSSDEEVARHVLWTAQKDVREAKDYCKFMMRKYRADEPSSWGIIEKATGRLVGTIGYMAYNEENSTVELGYSLAHWLWNGGYMTEALQKVIDYTFEAMEVNRIEAQHELSNPASGRVMEKCGMRKEGVLRQRLYNKGQFVDVALYAILQSDYRKDTSYCARDRSLPPPVAETGRRSVGNRKERPQARLCEFPGDEIPQAGFRAAALTYPLKNKGKSKNRTVAEGAAFDSD